MSTARQWSSACVRWRFKKTGTGPDHLQGLLHVGRETLRLCGCQIQGMLQDIPWSRALHPTNLSSSLAHWPGLQQPKAAKAAQSQLSAPSPAESSPQPCPASCRAPGDPQLGLCSVGLVLATVPWLRQPPGFQRCAGAVQHSVLHA